MLQAEQELVAPVSVFPVSASNETFLTRHFGPKPKQSNHTSSKANLAKARRPSGSRGVVMNQPVTFNRKIRSSGYGNATKQPGHHLNLQGPFTKQPPKTQK